jgi:hypothetical protein
MPQVSDSNLNALTQCLLSNIESVTGRREGVCSAIGGLKAEAPPGGASFIDGAVYSDTRPNAQYICLNLPERLFANARDVLQFGLRNEEKPLWSINTMSYGDFDRVITQSRFLKGYLQRNLPRRALCAKQRLAPQFGYPSGAHVTLRSGCPLLRG